MRAQIGRHQTVARIPDQTEERLCTIAKHQLGTLCASISVSIRNRRQSDAHSLGKTDYLDLHATFRGLIIAPAKRDREELDGSGDSWSNRAEQTGETADRRGRLASVLHGLRESLFNSLQSPEERSRRNWPREIRMPHHARPCALGRRNPPGCRRTTTLTFASSGSVRTHTAQARDSQRD